MTDNCEHIAAGEFERDVFDDRHISVAERKPGGGKQY